MMTSLPAHQRSWPPRIAGWGAVPALEARAPAVSPSADTGAAGNRDTMRSRREWAAGTQDRLVSRADTMAGSWTCEMRLLERSCSSCAIGL